MPTKYVLDESVVKGALGGVGCCLRAINTIVLRCDSLVYDKLWCEKCLAEVERHGHTAYGYALLWVMNYAFACPAKMIQETQPPPRLKDESEIHAKDLWLVRLAAAAEACIVTMDRPLLRVLRSRGAVCLGPDEVIEIEG